MKTKSKITSTPEGFIADIEAKQRNTVWPDTMRNSKSVDEVLWRGSSEAPLAQRIGICIFGLTFMLLGACMFEVGYEKSSRAFGLVAAAFILLGCKVFLNGLRKRKAKVSDENANPSVDDFQP